MSRYDRMVATELARHLEDWDKLPSGTKMFEALSDLCIAAARKLRDQSGEIQNYVDMNDRRKAADAVKALERDPA